MAADIKDQLVSALLASPQFALQLDKTTDVSNISQLMVYACYISPGDSTVKE